MSDVTGRAAIQSEAVTCPFCGSTDTELFSLFGQALLSSEYYCRGCHTVFEAVRWIEDAPEESEWA